jgi:prepilin-type N-terminal cleavage/methylation domain-containing protein
MNIPARTTLAFTIVELLIVIVIIGILAAISIVAFNGVTKQH